MSSENKVTLLRAHKAFNPGSSQDLEEFYRGFSGRLNELIDRARIVDMPGIGDGRMAAVAKLVNVSKPATRAWLVEDKPPRDALSRGAAANKVTLQSLVELFLRFIPGLDERDVKRVCVWLKHGEEITPNPLDRDELADRLPLVTAVVQKVAARSRLDLSPVDLNDVLSEVSALLNVYKVKRASDVERMHEDMIRVLLKNRLSDPS